MSAASPEPSALDDGGDREEHDQREQRHQQRLGVRARGDDDVLALVEELRVDGHGPIMSLRAARTCSTSPAATGVPATTSRPVVVDVGRLAGQLAAARQAHPHLLAERHARLEVAAAHPRAAAGRPGVVLLPEPGEQADEQGGAVGGATRSRARTDVAVGTGSSSAVWLTLSPIPTTAAGPWASPPARPGSRPASRSVRPSRRWATSGRPGRRARAAPRPRRCPRPAAATATRRPVASGRSRVEKVSAARSGVSQVRSSRPRPAVWCSVTTTSHSGAPSRARSATRALVDPACGTTSTPYGARRSASRGGRGSAAVGTGTRLARVSAQASPGEGTDVPDDIDTHTTAGKLQGPRAAARRGGPRRLGEGGREAARQGSQDRPRADRDPLRRGLVRGARRAGAAPVDGVRAGEEPPVRRRRGDRLRHHRRPPGVRVLPGLHDLRRLARRGLRREDHQGHGPRHQDRLPDHRHQRGRRGADPGGRGLARPLRRDLPPQRPRVGRHPPDQPDHGQLRRRPRLLPRRHRLHDHGRPDLRDVHHRTRRHQDRHRRGRHDGGPRRRAHPQHQVGQRPLHGRRRGGRARVRQGAAVVPPAEQPRPGAVVRRGRRTPERHRPRPLARHADPGRRQPALRHARRDHRRPRRRGLPRGAGDVRAQHHRRLRPRRGQLGRRRRQPAAAVRRHPRHRRLREGRPVRAVLRRVQHPGADVRRRARASCPAPTRSGTASSAAARS